MHLRRERKINSTRSYFQYLKKSYVTLKNRTWDLNKEI
uniref:Uncharacterized protein n=1 Tax=Caudovirales sp. ctCVG11 TaxID=2825759 RepID=A0A8S5UAX4_9CAUD|nr:MAG TPA: hypothetical protein [Caudovirales sp. ctCVG11]